MERALFDRGVAVIVLDSQPSLRHLRQLLANGLIVVMPATQTFGPQTAGWIELAEAAPIDESVHTGLRELAKRGVLRLRTGEAYGD